MKHVRRAAGLLVAALSLLAACASETPPRSLSPSPAEVGRAAAEELLGREDFMMYRVGEVEALHYAEAAAMLGAARFAAGTGDAALLGALAARWRRAKDENVPNTENHVDANVVGVIPLALFVAGAGDEGLRAEGLHLADGQWARTGAHGLTAQARWWIDDVWMIGALQVAAYRATGEAVYLDRAAKTAAAYLDRLQQPNGLFHHGPEAPFFWGRGNGWMAAGLAEILSELPQDHPLHGPLADGLKRMAATLIGYQAESGLWRQLIDDPGSWEETSGSAMFAYAFVAGVRRGILDDDPYTEAYLKAWRALAARLDAEGRLEGVVVGTGQSRDAQYYLDRPTVAGDFHGQAPMLWLSTALAAGEGE